MFGIRKHKPQLILRRLHIRHAFSKANNSTQFLQDVHILNKQKFRLKFDIAKK